MNVGIYGLSNVGKSTLFNLLTGQELSIVSPHRGTTTDPVRRRYEILDYAPVTFIDTAGLDDSGELGEERIKKSYQTIQEIDLALILSQNQGEHELEKNIIERLGPIPYIIIDRANFPSSPEAIFTKIRELVPAHSLVEPDFYGGLVTREDTVVLVCPIDSEAPSGRMILPQMQAVRGALDVGAVAVVVQPSELAKVLQGGVVRMVVTDSQVFDSVKQIIKDSPQPAVELTSFSILLAQRKGDMDLYRRALEYLPELKQGDKVLVIENCSHQVSCEDIGRVKIPLLLDAFVGGKLDYTFVGGRTPLPEDLQPYSFAVQCGGCMTTRAGVMNRLRMLSGAGVAVTNYGLLLNRLLP